MAQSQCPLPGRATSRLQRGPSLLPGSLAWGPSDPRTSRTQPLLRSPCQMPPVPRPHRLPPARLGPLSWNPGSLLTLPPPPPSSCSATFMVELGQAAPQGPRRLALAQAASSVPRPTPPPAITATVTAPGSGAVASPACPSTPASRGAAPGGVGVGEGMSAPAARCHPQHPDHALGACGPTR